jgi:radical SAM superfamily enzyme YgiQ (UPF0313 family)
MASGRGTRLPTHVPVRRSLETSPPERPRILLVNPRYPVNTWTFSEAQDITQVPAAMPNLALPTLAALTPDRFDVHLADENVAPVDLDEPWDLVAITGYISQRERMAELAEAHRARGRLVVIGGPFATLSSSTVRPHADVLFVGEAEETWPAFLDDYLAGSVQSTYEAGEAPDLTASPTPRVDLLPDGAFGLGVVQISRGCPYACEFCDVIVYLGRRQRHKDPEQLVRELDATYARGLRTVFLADDNLTANPKAARHVLRAIAEWNDRQPEHTVFQTQLSIELGAPRNTELLELCAAAGLETAFIGLETEDPETLRSVKKKHNAQRPMVESIHRIQQGGIQAMAGLIVGFDGDTTDCFDHQLDLCERAGLPMTVVSMLNAPEGTPLAARAAAEGRLVGETGNVYLSSNLRPVLMSPEELQLGARWLMNRLYSPAPFLDRLRTLGEHLPVVDRAPRAARRDDLELWTRLRRTFAAMGEEEATMPVQALRAVRGKNPNHAIQALTFYRHMVGTLQHWGLHDPELGRCETFAEATSHAHITGSSALQLT